MCIVLTVFVLGPLFTTLSIRDYFSNQHTFGYMRNIALYIVYYLPGVFSENRVPNAVNGSLWSLPVESVMYILVAMIGVLRGGRWMYPTLAILSAAGVVFWASNADLFVIYAFDFRQVLFCGTYFWVGATFYKYNIRQYFSISSFAFICILFLCIGYWPQLMRSASWVLLPFVVLAFGLSKSPMLTKFVQSGDYSYGIYIYAFPVQQGVAFIRPDMALEKYLVICGTITLALAILSWHLIERRALELKPRRPVHAN